MSSERKVLLERAYPEVLAFCRGLGLVFEVVDLCWGIRNVYSGDHESWEIFLQEIQTCKRISAGPAFVLLLGNRYGHRALPRVIPEKQFEVLMSKLYKKPEGIKQLSQWFLKDNNAVPPTYVLQPITAHFPHYKTQLLQFLRLAAANAEAAGDITAEQKQCFHTSGERHVIVCLLMFQGDSEVREGPKRLAKYMDLTADGLLDAEAQGLLANLKSRLYVSSQKILNLHCVELGKGSVDPKRKEHAEYLDSICEQFVTQMKARIMNRGTSDWMFEEAGQHLAMSAKLCKGLHGRDSLLGKLCLAMWESTNVRHAPLIIHGAAGMGKTALLCKLAQEMRSVLDAGSVVAIRLLSAHHPQRPDIDHVLHSICLQICLACGLSLPSPLTAGAHLELLRFFRNILAQVSQHGNSLLLILDSLDQLSDQHHAQRLHWLPTDLPPNVHLVVSMDTNSEVFANMRLKLASSGNFFEVEHLSHDEGKQVMESNMQAWQRMLTPEQSDAVLRCFDSTGCPLHLKLILSAARRWASFTLIADIHLGTNTQEMMSQLLQMLEEKHGKELVGGALGYLVLAREGLLEAELRDVMSLDNDVISEVYRYSLPPTPSLIRLPPLLWAQLKLDLEDHLEERWVGGVATIAFNNRRLVEVVSSRYLTSQRRRRSLSILAEYFLGQWSGKLKPATLPGLSLLVCDRKVPPQPLWFAPDVANVRKLQELPYHLLHAGLWEELRQEVIGEMTEESRVCGVTSVIHDLDQCSQYMDCTETRLVRDTLVLIKPICFSDMPLFYTELLARLCSLASTFPSVIGRLCSQCEEWLLTCPEPILVPKCSFLQQPGGALQHTLSGLHGGVLCADVSVPAELLAAGTDDGVVAVWSLADQQLIHTLLGHTGAVLCVKVIDNSFHCLSLAADGSLRRWSFINGQQLLCIHKAVPVDSAPSAIHIHMCERRQVLYVYTRTQVNLLQTSWFCLCSGYHFVLMANMKYNFTQYFQFYSDESRLRFPFTTGALLDCLCGSNFPVTSLVFYKGLVVSASTKTASIQLWNLNYDPRHKPIAHAPSGCAHVAITKDADRVFFVREPNQTEVISWNNLTGSLLDHLSVSAPVSCLELSQQKRLLLCGLTSGTVLIYPLLLPQETLCLPPPESLSRVLCLVVSSQERHLAVAYEDSACLFEITTRDSFPTVEGPLQRFSLSLLHAPLSSMALLSDCRLLYGTDCGEVRLHDFTSGGDSRLEPHGSRVTCVTASNWGTHALVGSEDAVQRLWALNPLALDHTMEYKGFYFEGILSAAFSDSDQFLFTGSQDRTVKVWDVSSGNLLYVQLVYSPVARMVTYRNGFVALTQEGFVIKEVFRCPEYISPDYNPLRNVKAQYRVTSREKNRDGQGPSTSDLQDFNPAQLNLNLMSMLRAKPSPACLIL
uniref:NACHT and WD repeat domain containing 1 n=1 Tax=Echeneis naucrates TaxID=173247 RepID=A0A665VJE0_ECHNA